MPRMTKKRMREELLNLAIDALALPLDEFRERAGQLSDLTSKTARGHTLLWEVTSGQQVDKVRALLDLGVPVDGETLCCAASGGGFPKKALKVFEVVVAPVKDANLCDDFGQSALFTATANTNWKPSERKKVVQQLLARGADPNLGQKQGVMPLHIATRLKQRDIVRLLLQAGADPAAVASGSYNFKMIRKGQTPITIATDTNQDDLLALLEGRDDGA